MALSQNLVNEFVKTMNPEPDRVKETTLEGVYRKTVDGVEYVKLDGSEIWTPVTSVVGANDDDRVRVTIKNHTATVTGNITSPSATGKDVSDLQGQYGDLNGKVDIIDGQISMFESDLDMMYSDVQILQSNFTAFQTDVNMQLTDVLTYKSRIEAVESTIEVHESTLSSIDSNIKSMNDDIESYGNRITQNENNIQQEHDRIDSQNNVIESHGNSLELFDSQIGILNSAFVIENGVLKGLDEIIVKDLIADNVVTEYLNAHYADIDFANITEASIEKLFADSGIINDLIMKDGKVTGELVGVTLRGDLIQAGTLVADKLVIKGEDGLFYKLNIEALGKEALEKMTNEQYGGNGTVFQEGLHGSSIIAYSITADKIQVSDLVAFNATIGGFHLTEHSIYSGVKQSIDNATKGIYMDDTGQFYLGDNLNYLKYFLDTKQNKWILNISAQSITMGTGKNLDQAIEDIEKNTVKQVDVMYGLSDSETEPPVEDVWTTIAPRWTTGKYMWQKTVTTYTDGSTKESEPTCIQGASGKDGKDGKDGAQGADGAPGKNGAPGKDGTSISITSTSIQYQLSDSGTKQPDTWLNDIPNLTKGKYLWTKTMVNYSDGTSTASYSVAYVAVDGATGKDGNGIKSIKYYYTTSTSQTAPDASKITSTTIPAMSLVNKYLWQKEVISFTNNTQDQVIISLIAIYGDGISNIKELYYLSNSNTTAPTLPTKTVTSTSTSAGLWTTKCPTYQNGYYYWTCSEVTYTDGTIKWTNAILASGINNANEKVENMEIGARNLIWNSTMLLENDYLPRNYRISGLNKIANWVSPFTNEGLHVITDDDATNGHPGGNGILLVFDNDLSNTMKPGETYTFSCYIKGTIDQSEDKDNINARRLRIMFNKEETGHIWDYQIQGTRFKDKLDPNEFRKFSYVFKLPEDAVYDVALCVILGFNTDVYIKNYKLEKGNKDTDWAPAPEDTQNDLNNTENDLNNTINETQKNLSQAIMKLEETFNVLCQSGSEMSIMEQTAQGWQFTMKSLIDADEANARAIESEGTQREKVSSQINKDGVSYVEIGTDADGRPCVLLGNSKSNNKVSISNDEIQFLELTRDDKGNITSENKVCYINNNTVYGNNFKALGDIIITDSNDNPTTNSLYYWRIRQNGNLSLNYSDAE